MPVRICLFMKCTYVRILKSNVNCGSEKNRFFFCWVAKRASIYFELVYFVTALVPSLTACLASSPGSKSLTAV